MLFALPRLGLAVLIGVVVSTPLTLLVFRDEGERDAAATLLSGVA